VSLQTQIAEDLKAAMKARDRERMSALRLLISAMKNEAIAEGRGPQGELSDAEVQRLLATEKKRRDEAAESYAANGREESAAKERAESELIASYLPQQLSDDELDALIDEIIAETGASGPSDMGAVMKGVMASAGNQAEGGRVSPRVKAKLSG
jgi:uncharacterized protein YqeY